MLHDDLEPALDVGDIGQQPIGFARGQRVIARRAGGVPDGGCSMVTMPTTTARRAASEQPVSTLLGHSASHSERLFLPHFDHFGRIAETAWLTIRAV
jgi:hypothetical protein